MLLYVVGDSTNHLKLQAGSHSAKPCQTASFLMDLMAQLKGTYEVGEEEHGSV